MLLLAVVPPGRRVSVASVCRVCVSAHPCYDWARLFRARIISGVQTATVSCSDEGVGLHGVVPPGWWERLHVTVVAGKSVNSRLSANQAELGVLVLSELLKMLSDGDGLLDEHVQVLGDLGSETSSLEDSENLAASDALDLGHAVAISKSDTNLGGG